MATKKGSKTAHVLNVLSHPKPGLAEDGALEKEAEVSQDELAEKVAPSRPVRVPILEVARANDDALSEQIRDLLEEDLLHGEAVAENQPEALKNPSNSIAESMLEDQGEEPAQEKSVDEPVAAPESAREELKQETGKTSNPQAFNGEKEQGTAPPDDFSYVNIMEALVEEKCMKYIKLFGLCPCSRCTADVKALALSNLPPKYLVMHQGEVIPMLTVYEGRFNSALTAQILNACKIVMECPRHKRA